MGMPFTSDLTDEASVLYDTITNVLEKKATSEEIKDIDYEAILQNYERKNVIEEDR